MADPKTTNDPSHGNAETGERGGDMQTAIDRIECTGCGAIVGEAEHASQDMIEVNGETFCTPCWDAWKAEMAVCDHPFEAGTCTRCGFVPNVIAQMEA